MTLGTKSYAGVALGWLIALGFAACSGTSGESEEGAAGAGPASAPEIQEARSALSRSRSPAVAEADYQSFISGTNDFGLDVFAALTRNDANFVFSPVSVAVALAMTYAGARNDTAAQMSAVLHNELPDETFHAANNRLSLDLESRNHDSYEIQGVDLGVTLRLVNATWAQRDYVFLDPFLDTLAVHYDAGVKLLDFIQDPEACRQTINGWVAYQTDGRIADLIGPNGLSSETRLVLTNALYFHASWSEPFDANATSDGPFYDLSGAEVRAEMMYQARDLPYSEGDGYQLVDLPYAWDQLALTVVLPASGRFGEIRAAMNDEWLAQARASISPMRVRLTLPKFRFSWGTASLKEPLQQLGMIDAFDGALADLTGMNPSGNLHIEDVLHQAQIIVDEAGTEAAAATAVIVNRDSSVILPPPDEITVTVDRPFLFFIRDSTGLLLFSGQVTDPTAAR